MQTVVHTNRRGCYFKYVKDDGPNFGYSSRVAYAMGLDKPHYPVPAIKVTVHIERTYVMVWPHDHKWPYYPAAQY